MDETVTYQEARREFEAIRSQMRPLAANYGYTQDEFDLLADYALSNEGTFLFMMEKILIPHRDRLDENPYRNYLQQEDLGKVLKSVSRILSYYDSFQKSFDGFKCRW